jgi:hypothetical protein
VSRPSTAKERHIVRVPIAAALAVAAAMLAAGCSPGKLERIDPDTYAGTGSGKVLRAKGLQAAIATGIKQQLKADVVVDCPDGERRKAGATFECTAENATTDKIPVIVTQKDDKGNVSWKVGAVNSDYVEKDIADGISTQKHVDITVTCPDIFELRKGAEFACLGVDGQGNKVAVKVTQTDDTGHVTWAT